MLYSQSNPAPHKEKHAVKLLSGENKGAVALFDSEESAKAECFYLSDVTGLCAARYVPIYSDHF